MFLALLLRAAVQFRWRIPGFEKSRDSSKKSRNPDHPFRARWRGPVVKSTRKGCCISARCLPICPCLLYRDRYVCAVQVLSEKSLCTWPYRGLTCRASFRSRRFRSLATASPVRWTHWSVVASTRPHLQQSPAWRLQKEGRDQPLLRGQPQNQLHGPPRARPHLQDLHSRPPRPMVPTGARKTPRRLKW